MIAWTIAAVIPAIWTGYLLGHRRASKKVQAAIRLMMATELHEIESIVADPETPSTREESPGACRWCGQPEHPAGGECFALDHGSVNRIDEVLAALDAYASHTSGGSGHG